MRPAAILAMGLALGACGREQAPPPQSRPLPAPTTALPAPDPGPPSAARIVERTPLDALAAADPELAKLPPRALEQAGAALDLAPAPCEACGGRSIARCLLDPDLDEDRCAVLPGLVRRAARVAATGAGFRIVERAVSYGDAWLPFAPLAADAAVPVEVWVDPASDLLPEVLDQARALASLDPGVVVRFRFLPSTPAAREVARRALAARDSGGEAAVLAGEAADGPAAPEAALDAEVALAAERGVRATPTWFVAGYRLRGAQSLDALERVVRLELYDLGRGPLPGPRPEPPGGAAGAKP